MKKVMFILLTVTIIIGCKSTPAASVPDELDMAIREASDYLNNNIPAGSKIVILNIQSTSAALSDYIIDELIANAVNDRIFEVVDRQQLDLIRMEQNFQLSGEVDDSLAVSIGKILGAQSIVSGAVTQLGDRYRMAIRALEVETARVQGQFNRNIAAGRTINDLMGGGSYSGTTYGTGRTATSGSSGGQSSTTPQNGTYTFWPRPRAMRSGVDVDVYIDRIVIRGGYLNVYLVNTPQGKGDPPGGIYQDYWSNFYGPNTHSLQDLDNPRNSWSMVNSGYDRDESGGIFLSFQGVTARRFSYTNNAYTPPLIFDEIVLGEPD